MKVPSLKSLAAAGSIALLINTAYVAAFASPTIFYMANVLAHVALGILVALAALAVVRRHRELRPALTLPVAFLAIALIVGLYLTVHGNLTTDRWALRLHVAFGVAAAVAILPFMARAARVRGAARTWAAGMAGASILALALPLGVAFYARSHPVRWARIVNPASAPISMAEEGGGPGSPFFPSSAKTNVGGIIPSNFFMDSATCGECHKDIYDQWQSSAHHFASFNNQFYRKSIEYMQSVVGPQPSKWCAGCHDHAVFFNGRFDRPIAEQIDTPEARAGLACTSCHAIVRVESTMGNGDFTIEYPPLHELATSKHRYVRARDRFLTYLNPEPHRRSFMKPYMRQDAAGFCSTCHKVHLDVPVNDYRWFRGFNDYDAWQASGVSGQGARSFYYPPKSSTCVDCHMPLVNSDDAGNIGGRVHDHRFIAANTALPFANKDEIQLKKTIEFLQNNQVTVDIFGINRVAEGSGLEEIPSGQPAAPRAATHFAEVEEMGAASGVGAALTDVTQLTAPLDPIAAVVRAGESVRVEVVVRTRGVGHFFPGGTVDAFDVWLALKAEDEKGLPFYWSGMVGDNGRGPVEKGAHFSRSLLLDEKSK